MNKNINKTVSLYKKAIEMNGNITAMNNLSYIYFKQRKTKAGLRLLTKAADLGSSTAQSQLGMSYYLGLYGKNIDYKKAFNLLSKSANQGDPTGQNNFGVIYYQGRAVKKNDYKAYFWFYIASEYGNNSKAKQLINAYDFNLSDSQKQKQLKKLKNG